jgi:predicted Zn-dependent peptidase
MIIQEINPLEMASLHVVYENLSPLDEVDGKHGMCHLIEHMIGKAVDPIAPTLHENGINNDYYVNYEMVAASFSGTAEAMEKLAPAIERQIVNSDANHFTEEDFESERRAVINEVEEMNSDVIQRTLGRATREVYGLHGPEGVLEDIRAYTFDEFKKDYGRLVAHPSRFVYVGPRKVLFSEVEFSERPTFRQIAPCKSSCNTPVFSASDIDDEYSYIVSLGAEPVVGNRDYAIVALAVNMLSISDEAVLLEQLRTKEGLVYSCIGSLGTFRNAGIPVFRTATAARNVEKVLHCMSEVFENPERYLTKELFERTKRYFGAIQKISHILHYCNCEDLVREGMISYEQDFENIEYSEFIEITKKHLCHGKFRTFVG